MQCVLTPLLDAIAASSIRRLKEDTTRQSLAHSSWSASGMLVPHQPFLQAIAAAAIRMSNDEFDAQQIGNMAWAVSQL